jgi:uncharacterized OsmC-like protein
MRWTLVMPVGMLLLAAAACLALRQGKPAASSQQPAEPAEATTSA